MVIGKASDRCNICGLRVREAREKIGLSQDQLTAKLQTEGLGVNQNSISRIETGKRIVADFEITPLAKVFGVEITWLLQEPLQE